MSGCAAGSAGAPVSSRWTGPSDRCATPPTCGLLGEAARDPPADPAERWTVVDPAVRWTIVGPVARWAVVRPVVRWTVVGPVARWAVARCRGGPPVAGRAAPAGSGSGRAPLSDADLSGRCSADAEVPVTLVRWPSPGETVRAARAPGSPCPGPTGDGPERTCR
ncbi:hypothetical protein GCM10012279_18630 [Micromonospora yangpuensis]|nr:hypothetical protein GCM10012279_18630 [Micromonospora yangpuensis]